MNLVGHSLKSFSRIFTICWDLLNIKIIISTDVLVKNSCVSKEINSSFKLLEFTNLLNDDGICYVSFDIITQMFYVHSQN